jgi:hypothetical protein
MPALDTGTDLAHFTRHLGLHLTLLQKDRFIPYGERARARWRNRLRRPNHVAERIPPSPAIFPSA